MIFFSRFLLNFAAILAVAFLFPAAGKYERQARTGVSRLTPPSLLFTVERAVLVFRWILGRPAWSAVVTGPSLTIWVARGLILATSVLNLVSTPI